jgi:hypothetical protein
MEDKEVVRRILESYKQREDYYTERLGASSISSRNCNLYWWHSFRWARKEETEPEIIRMFALGHLLEEWALSDLKNAGYRIEDKDSNGQQHERQSGVVVHKCDGIIYGVDDADENEPYLLEIKGLKQESLDKVRDKGLQKGSPGYFKQLQIGLTLFQMKAGLFVAISKNGNDFYIERVLRDSKLGVALIDQANATAALKEPPPKTQTSDQSTECRFCSIRNQCWEENQRFGQYRPVEKNCRSCRFFDVKIDGTDPVHLCGKTSKALSYDEQRAGCDQYRIINSMVPHQLVDDTPTESEFVDLSGDTIVQQIGKQIERIPS